MLGRGAQRSVIRCSSALSAERPGRNPAQVGRQIDFGILGSLTVTVDGAPVRLSGAKLRTVLAVLLLHPDEPVSVDVLIDAVWSAHPPASAQHALQVYVSNLRKALGRDVVGTHPGGYLVTVGPAGLDSAEFERLVADGRAALAGGD